MKKLLLLIALFITLAKLQGQSKPSIKIGRLSPKVGKTALIEPAENSGTQKIVHPKNTIQTSSIFSDSRNGFGTLIEETNPLHFNQDLNMISFTQRLATATFWLTTGLPLTDQKGFITTMYSINNGASWNGVCYFQDTIAWSRYPSGVIANAPGNTDPSEAKFVGTGPCTNPSGKWHNNWFASVPANSLGNITNNDQQTHSTNLDSLTSISCGTYFSSYNTIANGTTVWTSAMLVDSLYNNRGVAIFKGTRGTTVNDPYIWSVDTTTFNNWKVNSFGDYYCSKPKIAFSPNGQIGYILINGVLATATGNAATSMQPNVWKTTDGGLTWILVTQNYDWKVNHPEISCNLISTLHDDDWNGWVNEAYPAFFDAHGGGISVDNNGILHYSTTVTPSYSSHPDSLLYFYGQYGFSYEQNDDFTKPWIYDFTTNGGGAWDQRLIGKLWTRNVLWDDLVPDPATWTTDGTTPMDYSNRLRVSRSNDGTKIFYSWTDGDTTNLDAGVPDTYHANTHPNIKYKGYNVGTNLFSITKELSAFDASEGGYYNHYTSPIAMATGSGYRIPSVYISSQDGNQNATNAVDYNYISDMEIDNTEYTETIISNTNIVNPILCIPIINVSAVIGNSISYVSQNFPNPFNASSTVNVNLNKAENITLNVMNYIGQVISTQTVKGNSGTNELTIDAANLTNGVYFYSVIAGNSKVTRKMTIVK